MNILVDADLHGDISVASSQSIFSVAVEEANEKHALAELATLLKALGYTRTDLLNRQQELLNQLPVLDLSIPAHGDKSDRLKKEAALLFVISSAL